MRVRIGLETGFPDDRWLAWALDFAGVCAWGVDRSTALICLPKELTGWSSWVRRKGGWEWLPAGELDFRLVEAVSREGASRNVWFADDARPYDRVQAVRASQMLSWATEEMGRLKSKIEAEDLLSAPSAGCAAGDDSAISLMDAAEEGLADAGLVLHLPDGRQDHMEGLAVAQERAQALILELAGSRRQWEWEGERWSARKLMRVLVWNAFDHLAQAQCAAGLRAG